jgi:hypothetical protein
MLKKNEKKPRKLRLSTATFRELTNVELADVAGASHTCTELPPNHCKPF